MRIYLILSFSLISLAYASDDIDLSTPESTLKGYIKCLEKGSESCVLKHLYDSKRFYIKEPSKISYKITKKIIYGAPETESWHSKGIIPATKIGDIELNVEQEHWGKKNMYFYIMRKYDNKWYIISHVALGVD